MAQVADHCSGIAAYMPKIQRQTTAWTAISQCKALETRLPGSRHDASNTCFRVRLRIHCCLRVSLGVRLVYHLEVADGA